MTPATKAVAKRVDGAELRRQLTELLTKDEAAEFAAIHRALATPRNQYALEVARDAFAFANHHRHERSEANNIAVRSIVAITDELFEQFDAARLNHFVGKVAHKYAPFNFEDVASVLDEEVRLAHQASVFIGEFHQIFAAAEEHKLDALAAFQGGAFHFNSLRLSRIPGYIGPGASWGDFFGGVFCAIAVGVNAVAEIPTAGLATASIVAAVAGVGSEAYLQSK